MGNLAAHLAARFEALSLRDWRFDREARLFPSKLADRYGFRPQVDLLLTHLDGRRIAIEFEISRADPVANQVKFLIACETRALRIDDSLVSMFSSHVQRGRRHLSAAFVRHLRASGLAAFQVSLLPHLGPASIQRINQSSPQAILEAQLPAREELDRVLSVVEPRGEREHRIHFAGDATDVIANVWSWNDEIELPGGTAWGCRRVQFFVADPVSRQFAPSKFCAFIPASRPGGPPPPPLMTVPIYCSLGEEDPRFDGHRARTHLCNRLAFVEAAIDETPFSQDFERWAARHEARLQLAQSPRLLLPPEWY